MEGDINSEEEAGIVPRSVNAILQQLETSGMEFTIRVSFLELYNEELQDLLNTSGEKKLKLCEDVKKGVVCQNLEEIAVLNAHDIFDILQRGIQQRQTAATLCNKNSSRSHSIFTMKIMIKEYNLEGEEVVRHGQLNLVDLAGSECIGRSGAKNDRAREAGSINQSLLTLGRVITALVDHHPHVPYRDSKLTRLLQESLGGKAKTCIIATLSPAQAAVEETMSTLDYAYRARNIKNQPTVNQKLTKKVIMKEYFAEIETLRSQLYQTREKNGVYLSPEDFYAMESRLTTQEAQLLECESALKSRNDEFKSVKAEMDLLTDRLEETSTQLKTTTEELEQQQEIVCTVKHELTNAFIELKATEGIVSEQISTEKTLQHVGTSLQSIVEEKQSISQQLLKKVTTLEEKLDHNNQQSTTFIQKLQKQQEEFVHSIDEMSNKTTVQSESLVKGLAEILTQGKTTCLSLDQAISSALKVLLGDTSVCKDQMIQSCSVFEQSFHQNEQILCEQMTQLSTSLASWMTETQLTLNKVTNQLLAQEQSLQTMSKNMLSYQQQFNSNLTNFSQQQTKASQFMEQELHTMKTQLLTQQSTSSQQQTQALQSADVLIANKAKEIETQMISMLQSLVSTSKQSFGSTISMIENDVKSLEQVTNNAFTSLETQHSSMINEQNMFWSKKQQEDQSYLTSFTTSMNECTELTHELLQQNQSIDHSIGNKRKVLDNYTHELIDNIQQISKKNCVEIQSIGNLSNNMLTSITKSSENMKESSETALQHFETFLEQENQSLITQVQSFDSFTKEQFTQQSNHMNVLQSSLTKHMKVIESSIVPKTGSTPRKLRPLQPVTIVSTRNHQQIKQMVKSTQDMESLPYEVIVTQLKEYQENNDEITSSTTSSQPSSPPMLARMDSIGSNQSNDTFASTSDMSGKFSFENNTNETLDNNENIPNHILASSSKIAVRSSSRNSKLTRSRSASQSNTTNTPAIEL